MSFIATATRDPTAAASGNGTAQPGRPASSYAMPWGKHKGVPIDRVPADYLRWCLYKAENLNDEMRAEIEVQLGLLPGSTKVAPEEEIRVLNADLNRMKAAVKLLTEERDGLRRENLTLRTMQALRDHARPAVVNKAPKVESLRALVKGLYRRLTLQYHPDRGGSTEGMRIVVDLFKSLDEEIATWEKS